MNEDRRVDPSPGDQGFGTVSEQIGVPAVGPGHGSYLEPPENLPGNHADMVLFLGILSLFMCGPLGIIAWITGHSDLKKIRSGLMSPRRIGALKVGKAMGIVGTCLFVASFVIIGLIVQHGVTGLGFNWKSSPLRPHQLVFVGEWSGKKGTVIRIKANGRGDFRSYHSALLREEMCASRRGLYLSVPWDCQRLGTSTRPPILRMATGSWNWIMRYL